VCDESHAFEIRGSCNPLIQLAVASEQRGTDAAGYAALSADGPL
jgi:hypothetical protein